MEAATHIQLPERLREYAKPNSVVAFAPGRINLLGEHTDYNKGFVMPAAIDKRTWFILTPNTGSNYNLHSLDLGEKYTASAESIARTETHTWANYILGVLHGFMQQGITVPGFDAVFSGDIPMGAGLSSSAALECATALTLNQFTQAGFDKMKLAHIAQKAEHDFAGVQCGIMDQFASLFGKQGSIMKLDCGSLQYEQKPFNLDGYILVLLDSGVKHSLASSQYNIRRQQCEAGVALIQKHFTHVHSLRDATPSMLNELVKPVDELLYNRCLYVVQENQRVAEAAALLEDGDISAIGQKMFETHDGLSQLYEVSCTELDFLVNFVRGNAAVAGARMMGGGFGGCTLNLVKEEAVGALIQSATQAYQQQFGITLNAYPVAISESAALLNMDNNVSHYPHKRYNALTGEWVLVSPHRNNRPWQGQVEKPSANILPKYDPTCYLCPGNERSGGVHNPVYDDVFVFTNDFSALLPDTPDFTYADDLFKAEAEKGICRVICFSPRHDVTIPQMEVESIRKVINLWVSEYKVLGSNPDINYVQLFENKGEVMGCSNPHPHGQIWASQSLPVEPDKKQQMQLDYWQKRNSTLLADYLAKEIVKQERIIFSNTHFTALVPFWAIWPYEALIIPKRPMARITEMTEDEKNAFAEAYKRLTMIYDKVFGVSFPYSAGIHQAPTDGQPHNEWHWHMAFYPPLLRSASVKKFMVGYEMLAMPQRDITPEAAAQTLQTINKTL